MTDAFGGEVLFGKKYAWRYGVLGTGQEGEKDIFLHKIDIWVGRGIHDICEFKVSIFYIERGRCELPVTPHCNFQFSRNEYAIVSMMKMVTMVTKELKSDSVLLVSWFNIWHRILYSILHNFSTQL